MKFPKKTLPMKGQWHPNVQETRGVKTCKSALIQIPHTQDATQGWHTWQKSFSVYLTHTAGNWVGYSRASQSETGTMCRRYSWVCLPLLKHTPIPRKHFWRLESRVQRSGGCTNRKMKRSTFIYTVNHQDSTFLRKWNFIGKQWRGDAKPHHFEWKKK